MATGKRRSKSQIARDRKRVAELYLKGWLQVEIADELKIDQSTVSRDLSALLEEWKESALVDVDELKAQELAKINVLENEYWGAWKKSQDDAVTQTKERYMAGEKPESANKRIKEQEKRVGQVGDSSFLRGVQWCIQKRCELLGLDAPKKIDQKTEVLVKEYANVSPDDWDEESEDE